jgi:bacterioferritin-associated ferredoxin
MYVCFCAAVTDAEVRACAKRGADTVEEIGEVCAAGTGCGGCREHIAALLATTRPAEDWESLPRSA